MPLDKQVDLNNGRQILPWEILGSRFCDFVKTANGLKEHELYLNIFRKYYPILRGFPGPMYGPRAYGALGAPVPSPKYRFTKNQLLWMNAHRLGWFNYLEGTRNDFTKVVDFYHGVLQKELMPSNYVWGPFEKGAAYGPLPLLQGTYDLRARYDPYAKDGGMGGSLMAMRRWIQDLSSNKHVRIFGARRWNQFKLARVRKGGIPPLPANYLNKVLSNSVWALPPRWYNKRELVGIRYEDDASYLHEIFRAP
jgi:hypothetical protein